MNELFSKPKPTVIGRGFFLLMMGTMCAFVGAWLLFVRFTVPSGDFFWGVLAEELWKGLIFVGFSLGVARLVGTGIGFYDKWLLSTPWERGDPLPFESPLLHRGDLLRTAIFAGLAQVFGGHALPAIYSLAVGYLTGMLCLIGVSGQKKLVYVSILILVSPFLLIPNVGAAGWLIPGICLAIALVLSQFGVRRALEDFGKSRRKRWQVSGIVGNPFSPFRDIEKGDFSAISTSEGLLAAGSIAAIARFVALGSLDDSAAAVGFLFVWVAAAWRVLWFWMRHRAPTGIRGRLGSHRLIIPAYDRHLLPSLFAMLSIFPVYFVTTWLGIRADYSAAAITFVGISIVLALGPSYREFHLTGSYREAKRNLESGNKKSGGYERL